MTQPNDDINLLQVFSTLRRSLLPILGATVLIAAGTYLVSRSQAPVYESRSSIISLFSSAGNQVINNTLVTQYGAILSLVLGVPSLVLLFFARRLVRGSYLTAGFGV